MISSTKPFLLGPPQIHGRDTTTTTVVVNPDPNAISKQILLSTNPSLESPRSSPCLNLFFSVTLDPSAITHWLDLAWKENPLTALKLICHLSFVGVDGKPNKEIFFESVLWLYKKHPFVFATNLENFANFGYLKDFPEILYRILKFEVSLKKKPNWLNYSRQRSYAMWNNSTKIVEKEEKIRVLRKMKDMVRTKRAIKIYSNSPKYQLLHNSVSDLFAKLLKSDFEFLISGKIENISMASKWCPSINRLYDKRTLICESIARRIFPQNSDPEYSNLEYAHYVYRVRNRLMKEILVPLRKALASVRSNNSIADKPNVVSVSLKKMYAKLFSLDEKERFKASMEIGVKKCRRRKQLFPHHIIAAASMSSRSKEVVELQWNTLLGNLRNTRKSRNCLAVWGISKAIRTEKEMSICISMGLLISQFGNEFWKGKILTCGGNPKFYEVEGNDLESRIEFLRKLECNNGNLNVEKVFDQILEFAVAENIPPEQMVEKIIVLGDMGFVKSSMCFWGIWGSFRSKGYIKLPEIVFWDMKGECSWSEVAKKQTGVSIISGSCDYSVAALMEEAKMPVLEVLVGSIPKPESVMQSALSGGPYDNLFIFH